MPTSVELILLALVWLIYFLSHSLLASLWMKRVFAQYLPTAAPWYRLLFNLVALLLLAPPLYMLWSYRSDPLWQWQGAMAWLAYGLMIISLAGFIWSMRYYDGREFLGIRQLQRQQQDVNDLERLHISPLHRFVRHPWYSLGLILIWAQEMDPARLVSAIAVTCYLALGSRLEENKLLVYHGETYRNYQKRVPGLIPRPWRFLTRRETEKLLEEMKT
ncbi:MAG: methyltransferase family protein [Candidatus Thiodiazotropha sp.]